MRQKPKLTLLLPKFRADLLFFLPFILVLSGCHHLENATQHDFTDGYYRYSVKGAPAERMYVTVSEDTLMLYPLIGEGKSVTADTTSPMVIPIEKVRVKNPPVYGLLSKSTLDLDLLTIVFKYRPGQGEMVNQLNTNFNAAAYLGYRWDYFRIIAAKAPLPVVKMKRFHFGFDAGIFAGIGHTAVNPWVTEYAIDSEYDGVVFQKGLGIFLGMDEFGFGIVLGFDTLLDKNHKYWIYQEKPYLGLAIGLTLQ